MGSVASPGLPQRLHSTADQPLAVMINFNEWALALTTIAVIVHSF